MTSLHKNPAKPAVPTYATGPRKKFKPSVLLKQEAKDRIHLVLLDKVLKAKYDPEKIGQYMKEISEEIKTKIKEMNMQMNVQRYKLLVQVILGQNNGQGIKYGSRCFWDSDTDNLAWDYIVTESMFCIGAVYAIYMY